MNRLRARIGRVALVDETPGAVDEAECEHGDHDFAEREADGPSVERDAAPSWLMRLRLRFSRHVARLPSIGTRDRECAKERLRRQAALRCPASRIRTKSRDGNCGRHARVLGRSAGSWAAEAKLALRSRKRRSRLASC